MLNKIEKIRLILKLSDEGVLTLEETLKKIKIVVQQNIDNKEIPDSGEIVIRSEKRKRNKVRRGFTLSELRYITKNLNSLGIQQIATDLGRSYQSIYNKIPKMKLKTEKKHSWTKKLDNQIKSEIEMGTTQLQIAEKLGISLPKLKHRIRKIRGQE